MLAQLDADLRHGRYRAKAVRRAYIPKGKTGRRALGIPTIVIGLSRRRSRRCWKLFTNRSFGPVPLASDQDEAPSNAFAMWRKPTKLGQRGLSKVTWSSASTPFRVWRQAFWLWHTNSAAVDLKLRSAGSDGCRRQEAAAGSVERAPLAAMRRPFGEFGQASSRANHAWEAPQSGCTIRVPEP
jgi:hypothetical protein